MIALALYGDEDIGLGLKEPVFAMDSTTIDLCLSLFPWAHFRQTKAAVKAHVVMDLRGAIPVFISITTGKIQDVRQLDAIRLLAGSILVIDGAIWTSPGCLPCTGRRSASSSAPRTICALPG